MIESIYMDEYWIDQALKFWLSPFQKSETSHFLRRSAWQFASKAWGMELCKTTMLEF